MAASTHATTFTHLLVPPCVPYCVPTSLHTRCQGSHVPTYFCLLACHAARPLFPLLAAQAHGQGRPQLCRSLSEPTLLHLAAARGAAEQTARRDRSSQRRRARSHEVTARPLLAQPTYTYSAT